VELKNDRKMIILRQKLFTFQDKKAWEELKAATNNFTTLPNGRGKMNARDVIQFKKWAELVDQGRMNEVDWKEAKKVFEHIDLPETAKGLEHLSHKYRLIQDPEFQNRYETMMSGDIYRKAEKLDHDLESRYKREASRPNTNIDQITAKYQKLRDQNIERLNKTHKRGQPLLDVFGGVQEHVRLGERDNRRSDRYDNLSKKRTIGRSGDFIAKEMRRLNIRPRFSIANPGDYFDPQHPNEITISTRSPFTVLHELGHAQNYRKGYTTGDSDLSRFAEENLATSRALARTRLGIKQGELNPKIEKRIRKAGEAALGTYYHAGINDTLIGIRKLMKR